ncbi:MAG: hypothetical protein ACR2N8_03005 [Parvibaculales bacterium]
MPTYLQEQAAKMRDKILGTKQPDENPIEPLVVEKTDEFGYFGLNTDIPEDFDFSRRWTGLEDFLFDRPGFIREMTFESALRTTYPIKISDFYMRGKKSIFGDRDIWGSEETIRLPVAALALIFDAKLCWDAYKTVASSDILSEIRMPLPFGFNTIRDDTIKVSAGWLVSSKTLLKEVSVARQGMSAIKPPHCTTIIHYRNFVSKKYRTALDSVQDFTYENETVKALYKDHRIGDYSVFAKGKVLSKFYEFLDILYENQRMIR